VLFELKVCPFYNYTRAAAFDWTRINSISFTLVPVCPVMNASPKALKMAKELLLSSSVWSLEARLSLPNKAASLSIDVEFTKAPK